MDLTRVRRSGPYCCVPRAVAGITLLEILVTVVIASLLMGMTTSAMRTLGRQQRRERLAREVLWEVTVARSFALRGAVPMALVADSAHKTLTVRDAYGTVYRTLGLGTGTEFAASGLVINVAGDSLAFSSRGVCLNCDAGGATTITVTTLGQPPTTMKVGVLGRAELVGYSRT